MAFAELLATFSRFLVQGSILCGKERVSPRGRNPAWDHGWLCASSKGDPTLDSGLLTASRAAPAPSVNCANGGGEFGQGTYGYRVLKGNINIVGGRQFPIDRIDQQFAHERPR